MEHPLVDQTFAVSLLVVDGWYFWGCRLDTLICKNTLNSGIICGRIRSHLQVITTCKSIHQFKLSAENIIVNSKRNHVTILENTTVSFNNSTGTRWAPTSYK